MTALPQGEDKARIVRSMFDTIAPRYEKLNRLVSLGLDGRWRRIALRKAGFKSNSVIIDIATGTGDFLRLLDTAGHFPIGIDVSYGMLAAARTSSPLIQCDGLQLPFADASVDGITCGFALRNVTDLDALFVELARVTKPGGRIALLDAAQPENKIVGFGHNLWFNRVVPRIGATFSDKAAYSYLPKSLAYLPPPEELKAKVADAGFDHVERDALLMGATQLLTATRSA